MDQGGETLRLLSDCRTYALGLDRDEAARAPWQQAAKLMIEAAQGGSLEDVVQQFEQICPTGISRCRKADRRSPSRQKNQPSRACVE